MKSNVSGTLRVPPANGTRSVPDTLEPLASFQEREGVVVADRGISRRETPLRIGAVAYLNARPLTYCLAGKVPAGEITLDLPSRLADALARAELMWRWSPRSSISGSRVPSSFRTCASRARARSRASSCLAETPIREMKTLALDEGSRTSAAFTRHLTEGAVQAEPRLERLPAGVSLLDCSADAVLLIGDRGILAPEEKFEFVWDLGEEWTHWTGLPFVFALWVARPGLDWGGAEGRLGEAFASARDEGLGRLEEIARVESPRVGAVGRRVFELFLRPFAFSPWPARTQWTGDVLPAGCPAWFGAGRVNLVFSDRVSA